MRSIFLRIFLGGVGSKTICGSVFLVVVERCLWWCVVLSKFLWDFLGVNFMNVLHC